MGFTSDVRHLIFFALFLAIGWLTGAKVAGTRYFWLGTCLVLAVVYPVLQSCLGAREGERRRCNLFAVLYCHSRPGWFIVRGSGSFFFFSALFFFFFWVLFVVCFFLCLEWSHGVVGVYYYYYFSRKREWRSVSDHTRCSFFLKREDIPTPSHHRHRHRHRRLKQLQRYQR